jgi:aerobic-type carbon monoxide dehydrogenase small subunit (CoxS/CutS family)
VTEPQTVPVTLTVNGKICRGTVEPRTSLADWLRDDVGLTGVNQGCEHGVCGACTVLVDGHSARSCMVLTVQADGSKVQTVESLASPTGDLHPLQDAFWEKQGLQCGFCTPGMLMRALEMIKENPDLDKDQAREGIASNLCRCTGYQYIVESIVEGAAKMRGADRVDQPLTH